MSSSASATTPRASLSQVVNDTALDVWVSFRTGSRGRPEQCLYYANSGSARSGQGVVTARTALPKPSPGTVRLILVSDTHGRHQSLGRLPDGDVLMHW